MSKRVPFWSDVNKTRTLPQTRTLPTVLPDFEDKPDSLETLAAASNETLEALMLAKMNTAQNLQRDIAMLIAEVADQLAEAKLAEMLLAQRRKREAKP
jgi:hypothetical protein